MASHQHSTSVSDGAESSRDQSSETTPPSRESPRLPKGKQRVRFTPGGESLDSENRKTAFDVGDDINAPPKPRPFPRSKLGISHNRSYSAPLSALPSSSSISVDIAEPSSRAPIPKPRPSIMRPPSANFDGNNAKKKFNELKNRQEGEGEDQGQNDNDENEEKKAESDPQAMGKVLSQQSAHRKAQRLSRLVGSHSAPGSRYSSPIIQRSPPPSPPSEANSELSLDLSNIPLQRLEERRTYGIEDETDDDEENEAGDRPPPNETHKKRKRLQAAAQRLVGRNVSRDRPTLYRVQAQSSETLRSGQTTPTYERDPEIYVPRPREYREGYLSSILKLYNEQGMGPTLANIPSGREAVARAANRREGSDQPLLDSTQTSPAQTPGASPTSSGATTPKQKHQKWYYKNPQSQSTGSIADLVGSSTVLAQPGSSKTTAAVRPKPKTKPLSDRAIETVLGKKKKERDEASLKIRIHIEETVLRQTYLQAICRALMTYGAPTHRLEEYMRMSARVLEIDGQFLYLPGCMIISFDDPSSHTTEVKIVRVSQDIDLGRLRDCHEIYKEVVHDKIGVKEAIEQLSALSKRKDLYSKWTRVVIYGLASACVGPFAFGARPIDVPIIFVLGTLLGIMKLVIAPKSDLYSNVLEITAAVLTSFLARAFGSIKGGSIFCFSALAQSAIALILPGYTVLCGSLELQSRNIVPGSVRMVYAIIYSLFLGFGITIGTSFYGGVDRHATSSTQCSTTMPMWWKFIFVPPFTLCLIIINHGKWKQMPVMLFIAFVGYVVNYFSALRFASNAQIANTLGALAIGVLGNLYSRVRHGLAATALLPAIFVQVPSGLAASGSLVSGITSANQITNHIASNGTSMANGSTTISTASAPTSGLDLNTTVFNVGYSMIQVAIGITVGLFLSALTVYPFGKKRSGLFSF